MRHYRQFTRILVVALGALLVLTLLLAYSTSYFSPAAEERNVLGLTNWSFGLLISSSMIGALLIVAYGSPLFTMLWSRNSAHWLYVVLLGVAPGLSVAALLGWSYSYWIIGFGLVVATAVRVVFGQGPRQFIQAESTIAA